jgi:hypothetical protein
VFSAVSHGTAPPAGSVGVHAKWRQIGVGIAEMIHVLSILDGTDRIPVAVAAIRFQIADAPANV